MAAAATARPSGRSRSLHVLSSPPPGRLAWVSCAGTWRMGRGRGVTEGHAGSRGLGVARPGWYLRQSPRALLSTGAVRSSVGSAVPFLAEPLGQQRVVSRHTFSRNSAGVAMLPQDHGFRWPRWPLQVLTSLPSPASPGRVDPRVGWGRDGGSGAGAGSPDLKRPQRREEGKFVYWGFRTKGNLHGPEWDPKGPKLVPPAPRSCSLRESE